MTPAKQVKAAGLKSLAEVAEMTGQYRQTLDSWAVQKPELFRVILAGCMAIKDKNNV